MRRAIGLAFTAAAVAGLAAPSEADAYASASAFSDDPVTGGGGGRYFTGTARDRYTCEVCHSGGASPGVVVDGLPGDRLDWGERYTVSIRSSVPASEVLAEITDSLGVPLGTLERLPMEMLQDTELCASGLPAASIVEDDGRAIAAMSPCGAQQLRFVWASPTFVARDALLHVVAVAGDDSDGPEGDGVFAAAYQLDAAEVTDAVADVRCSTTGESGAPLWVGLVLLLGWGSRARRERASC